MGIGYLKIGFLGTQINLQTVVVVPWIFQIMKNPFFGYTKHHHYTYAHVYVLTYGIVQHNMISNALTYTESLFPKKSY